MRFTVPLASEVERLFAAYLHARIGASPDRANASPQARQAFEKSTPQIVQLLRAVSTYHSTPKQKAFLPNLVVATDQALNAVKRLEAHFPLRPGETFDSLSRDYINRTLSEDRARQYHLRNWHESIESELQFLRGLQQYVSPLGRELVRRALKQRYQTTADGVLMVGLHPSQVHEHLDPRHRATVPFLTAFHGWLKKQIDDGLDPADGIIDFLLDWDSNAYDASGRSMSVDRLKSHELKFRDGRIFAYYVTVGAHQKTRYFMAFHDRKADILSVRRDTYDSVGGGGTGAANRGGDFIKGDTYVVGKDGKFYSFAGSTIHSEFFSGAAVQAAGIIVVSDGKVQAIDNRSGHYRPGWKSLVQAVALLNNKHQVFDSEAVVGLVSSSESTMFFTVDDFLRLGVAGFPFTDTTAVVRSYQTQYKGRIPVPSSKMEYIPPDLRKGWHNRAGGNWDLFFQHFYPKHRQAKPEDVGSLRPLQDWG